MGVIPPKSSPEHLMEHPFDVRVLFDDEAKVFVATSDDIPGLVTEADTFEELVQHVAELTPVLLHANRATPRDADGILIRYTQEQHLQLARVA